VGGGWCRNALPLRNASDIGSGIHDSLEADDRWVGCY